MIGATFTQGGTYCVQDVPPPRAADDELLLRVGASSICGTDLRMIRNGLAVRGEFVDRAQVGPGRPSVKRV